MAWPFPTAGKRRLPASLKNIFKELASDTGSALRGRGDLSDWARQGVLLLNTALSVEAGKAGAHIAAGWQGLTDEIMCELAQQDGPLVPILWGDRARRYAALFAKHEVIESPASVAAVSLSRIFRFSPIFTHQCAAERTGRCTDYVGVSIPKKWYGFARGAVLTLLMPVSQTPRDTGLSFRGALPHIAEDNLAKCGS